MKSRPTDQLPPWLPEMMTPEQRKNVTRVYNHLLENEKRGWDGLDNYMDMLDYLDDDQLHREADVIFEQHSRGTVKCEKTHPIEQCLIPILVEAVAAILELFKETNNLHIKNRYILQYYLAMQQCNMIVFEESVKA